MTDSPPVPDPHAPAAELILQELGHAVVVVDPDGLIGYWNRAATRTFGWTAAEAEGREIADLLQVELDPVHSGGILDVVTEAGDLTAPELCGCWVRTRDGELKAMLATVCSIGDAEGLVAITIVAADATTLRAAEQERWLGFEQGAVATAIVDPDGRISRANAACSQFLGREESDIVGRRATDFIHPEDAVRIIPLSISSGELDKMAVERKFIRPDGGVVWGLVSLSAERDASGGLAHMYVQAQDITDRKRAEDALIHQALHDQVTGLPNRALIQDRLEGALARARRYGRTVAVVFGDIDRFGLVNDTLGHQAGDQLLIEVARRLSGATAGGDTAGRFGGDEFVVICEDVNGVEPDALGGRMTSLFDEPFTIEGQTLFVTISCGVVIAGPHDTAGSCLRDADNAVTAAKRRGRNRTETFDLKLRHRVTRQLDLETALRRAVDATGSLAAAGGSDEIAEVSSGDLYMAYQPVMDLRSNRAIAVEALMRWSERSGAEVSPTEFIPLAEQSDLILALGEFALSQAIEDVTRWRRDLAGAEDLCVAVNISSRELTRQLLPLCKGIIEANGAEPRSLILEITERGVMTDVGESVEVLEQLAAYGVRISIDDFGTGYSSLEYLKRLPASSIKIDRSFIADLGSTAEDAAIVRAVVDLARAIGMDACAEGVESAEQLAALVALDCHFGQGYYWHTPMPAAAFESWFTSNK